MNKFLFLLYFFSTSLMFSQNSSVQVIYKVKDVVSDANMNTIPSNIKNTLISVIKEAEKQSFVLTYSSNQSSYIAENMMTKGETGSNISMLARAQFTGMYDYFFDFYTNVEILKNNNDSKLLSKKYIPLNWKVTSESTTIDGYLCYKAFFEIPYITRDNRERNKTGYVWFTPSLPFTIGPKEYVGLPGLVIEVHEENIVYYADKINLNSVQKVIFPKGKIMPKEEYDKKLKAQMGM